jgi:protein-disulfide isomerase
MKTFLTASLLPIALMSACSKGTDPAGNTAEPSKVVAVAAPSGTDWTATVTKTADGGYLMGNPAATVKLLEFGALSCPHCAKFSRESSEGLKALVTKGTVSYEFRPFLIHAQDVAASLLAACNGPAPFFAIAEQMYAKQEEWNSAAAFTPEDQKAMQGMAPLQLAGMIASKMKLDTFVEQRGVSAAKAKACLTDQAALDALGKVSEQGQAQFKITGTPTFIINGQVVPDANTWEGIEPLLKSAGA